MSGDIKIPTTKGLKFLIETPNEEEIQKFGRKYIKILVTDLITSRKDLAARLKKRWPDIRFFLGNQNRRYRKLKHPDLVYYIIKLNQLPIDVLYKQAGIEKSEYRHLYKDQLIAKILFLRGKAPAESVKKYLHKYKKFFRES